MNVFQRARNRAHTKQRDTVCRKVPHDPEKTLVIIDMQSGFMSEEEDYAILTPICSLIRHAKHQEWAIIVVEYHGHGETDELIQESLAGYPHWTTVQKGNCDGGDEIIGCINAHPTWSMDLLLCGIYGPECVALTVCGLFEKSDLVEVSVVTDAVSPEYISCSEELADGTNQEREIQTDDVVCSRQESSVCL